MRWLSSTKHNVIGIVVVAKSAWSPCIVHPLPRNVQDLEAKLQLLNKQILPGKEKTLVRVGNHSASYPYCTIPLTTRYVMMDRKQFNNARGLWVEQQASLSSRATAALDHLRPILQLHPNDAVVFWIEGGGMAVTSARNCLSIDRVPQLWKKPDSTDSVVSMTTLRLDSGGCDDVLGGELAFSVSDNSSLSPTAPSTCCDPT